MNKLIEYFTGLDTLTDQVVAMDVLVSAKSAVRNYAMAITEVGSPDVMAALAKQLEDAIDFHERISAYMIERGWYRPWDVKEQLELDIRNIGIALKAPTL